MLHAKIIKIETELFKCWQSYFCDMVYKPDTNVVRPSKTKMTTTSGDPGIICGSAGDW